jgi:hypothetical protein
MPAEAEETQGHAYVKLLHHAMIFLAALVVARFVLEVAGVPSGTTRFLSSTAGLFLVAIYLAAVAPLRGGLAKFCQLPVPAILLSAWTAGWIIVATIISAVFRLERSHFAEKSDIGNWSNLGRHVLGHLIEIVVFFVIVLIVMAATHVLWRWNRLDWPPWKRWPVAFRRSVPTWEESRKSFAMASRVIWFHLATCRPWPRAPSTSSPAPSAASRWARQPGSAPSANSAATTSSRCT